MFRNGLYENAEFYRYHPIVNFVYFALVIGITMFSMSPYFLAVTFGFSWIYSVLLRGKEIIKFNLMMCFSIMVVMVIINLFFSGNGETVLFYINTNRITAESAVYGAASAVMLISVVIWFTSFNVMISADKLIYLFGKAAPVLGLTLSMIFRFIPLLKNRFAEITLGQKCMKRSHSEGNPIKRSRQLLKEVSILIAWSLEASIESADSMEARGYGLKGRTSFHLYRFTGRDTAALILMTAVSLPVIYGISTGLTNMYFYPKLVLPEMNLQTAVILMCYCVLAAVPILIDLAGEYKWRQLDLTI